LRVSFRDSSGIAKISQKQDYDVYGSELQGLSYTKPLWNQDNFKFLGRESIEQTGYVDLLNRQYDKILGRFTSPDPVTDGQESQSLFQYSWNNPVLLSDPNGLMPDEPWYKRILPKTVTLETSASIGLQIGAKASVNNYEIKADANLVSLKVFSDKIGVEKGNFVQKSTFMNGVVEAGKEANGKGNFEVKHGLGVTAKVAGNEYGLGAEHTSTIDNHGNHIGDKTSYTVFEAKNKETLGKDENIVSHGNTSIKASASKSMSGNVKIERQNGQTDLKYNFGFTIGAKAILGVELKFNISNQ